MNGRDRLRIVGGIAFLALMGLGSCSAPTAGTTPQIVTPLPPEERRAEPTGLPTTTPFMAATPTLAVGGPTILPPERPPEVLEVPTEILERPPEVEGIPYPPETPICGYEESDSGYPPKGE